MLYGTGVVVTRVVLISAGIPGVYDKLLCVPVLNLCVVSLDRFGDHIARFFAPTERWGRVLESNWVHMGCWLALFAVMTNTGYLQTFASQGSDNSIGVECLEGQPGACVTWVRALRVSCEKGSSFSCSTLARVVGEGTLVPSDPWTAGAALRRACDLGDAASRGALRK